jgi:uncharacterized cupin superfamily protein
MVEEAKLQDAGAGLEPAGKGWFVVNAVDAAWLTNETFGAVCVFESDADRWDIGYSLEVVWPGKPTGMYHRESNQEDFLVLSGECLLIVEGEERRLEAWDFVHCPPDTEHIFVGAGDGPCVIFMIGARSNPKRIVYPRSELALRHGAGVETETAVPAEAYEPFPDWVAQRPEDPGALLE